MSDYPGLSVQPRLPTDTELESLKDAFAIAHARCRCGCPVTRGINEADGILFCYGCRRACPECKCRARA